MTTRGISAATPNTSIMRTTKSKYSAPVTRFSNPLGTNPIRTRNAFGSTT